MMRELCKKPEDIAGTAALEEYIGNMSNDLRANQELIDEMRAMNSVLDEYFYSVAYEHFERQTSVALWPVKIGEQAEKAKDFCAAIRAKYLQAQIGEQEAFADSLNELQEFALSFDQYTSLDVCEEAARKARDCMRQVEAAPASKLGYLMRVALRAGNTFGVRLKLWDTNSDVRTRRQHEAEVVPTQDYQLHASNIKKRAWRPYFQLWDTADQWLVRGPNSGTLPPL